MSLTPGAHHSGQHPLIPAPHHSGQLPHPISITQDSFICKQNDLRKGSRNWDKDETFLGDSELLISPFLSIPCLFPNSEFFSSQDVFGGHQEWGSGRWFSVPMRRRKWVTQETGRQRETGRGQWEGRDLGGSFSQKLKVFPNNKATRGGTWDLGFQEQTIVHPS